MLCFAANPFISAYVEADGFGKAIFLSLFFLSALSWTLLIYKGWLFFQIDRSTKKLLGRFFEEDFFHFQLERPLRNRLLQAPHPLFEVYKSCKQKTLLFLEKNSSRLFAADFETLENDLEATIVSQGLLIDQSLFLFPLITALAPFIGLLGTVWGILTTFSHLSIKGIAINNGAMLSGLALALATTVCGLVIAIPALIAHSIFKEKSKQIKKEMARFAFAILSSLELQYKAPTHEKIETTPV